MRPIAASYGIVLHIGAAEFPPPHRVSQFVRYRSNVNKHNQDA